MFYQGQLQLGTPPSRIGYCFPVALVLAFESTFVHLTEMLLSGMFIGLVPNAYESDSSFAHH